MGPKHPISLKLKKYNSWNSTLYKFNSSDPILQGIGKQKNIIKSINHYFQYLIISKPLLRFENNKLKIKIFYFVKPNINSIFVKNYIPPWNSLQIYKLEKLFNNYFGYSTELQLIKINNPIYNANILAKLIAINLKTYGIGKIWKILLRKIKLKNNIKSAIDFNSIIKNKQGIINWMHILNKGIFCKEFYSHIIGLKLKLSGRISKRRGASRTSTLSRSIGTLQFNSINSFIDYGHIEKKDKNGSQSIKVFIASSIFFNN